MMIVDGGSWGDAAAKRLAGPIDRGRQRFCVCMCVV